MWLDHIAPVVVRTGFVVEHEDIELVVELPSVQVVLVNIELGVELGVELVADLEGIEREVEQVRQQERLVLVGRHLRH